MVECCSWLRLIELLQSQASKNDCKEEETLLKEERISLHTHLRWTKKQQDRQIVEEEAIGYHQLHIHLGQYILLHRRATTSKRKEKSNVTLACQVLCNIITLCSSKVINAVVLHDIPFEFSHQHRDNILRNLHQQDDETQKYKLCWVDLIQCCVCKHENRFAFEAIIAAIYNATIKLKQTSILTTASWLWTCLMRYYLPVSTAVTDGEGVDDEATDWIALLVHHLRDSINILYALIGKAQSSHDIQHEHVTPEQVVLFHALLRGQELNSTMMSDEEAIRKGQNGNIFVAELLCNLLISTKNKENMEWYEGEADCQQSIIQTSYEYLANILSNTNTVKISDETNQNKSSPYHLHELRQDIGSILMIPLLRDLHQQHQELQKQLPILSSKTSTGKKPPMPPKELHSRLLVLVRLMGNLCFQCVHNQDLLQQPINDSLNGLHVLLNTTSVGNGLLTLFPLREWTIVAIRYAIQDHRLNQSTVEELQPQDFTNTTKEFFQQQNMEPQLHNDTNKVTLTPNGTIKHTSEQKNGST